VGGWGKSQFRRGAYTVVLFICTYFVGRGVRLEESFHLYSKGRRNENLQIKIKERQISFKFKYFGKTEYDHTSKYNKIKIVGIKDVFHLLKEAYQCRFW
jgi:hypothetical protein